MGSTLLLDFDVDDLASVALVDEETLISVLRCRYRKHKTIVGDEKKSECPDNLTIRNKVAHCHLCRF